MYITKAIIPRTGSWGTPNARPWGNDISPLTHTHTVFCLSSMIYTMQGLFTYLYICPTDQNCHFIMCILQEVTILVVIAFALIMG